MGLLPVSSLVPCYKALPWGHHYIVWWHHGTPSLEFLRVLYWFWKVELITINFTYGHQLIRGEDPIRGGKSSAFLLNAQRGALTPPWHDFSTSLGFGEGSFIIFQIQIKEICFFSSGATHPTGIPTWGHMRGNPALKVPRLPQSYTPNRSKN